MVTRKGANNERGIFGIHHSCNLPQEIFMWKKWFSGQSFSFLPQQPSDLIPSSNTVFFFMLDTQQQVGNTHSGVGDSLIGLCTLLVLMETTCNAAQKQRCGVFEDRGSHHFVQLRDGIVMASLTVLMF